MIFIEITEEEENKIWKDAVFVFDSCALLNFYDYSLDTRKNIFDTTLKTLKGRLWIPNQVQYEFLKNRLNTLRKPIELYIELKNDHLKKIAEQLNQLSNKTKKNNRHPYLDPTPINDFVGLFKVFSERIQGDIESQINEIEKMSDTDDVLVGFNKYFEKGKEYTFKELMIIVEEGEIRYRNTIPPGYKDENDKIGLQQYGDLILWKQILDFAKIKNKPVVFITDDVKEDWWHIKGKKEIERPREELIKEFHNDTGSKFWMYTSIVFLEKAKKFLDTKIKENALFEVRNSSSHYSAIYAESAFITWAVNEYKNAGDLIFSDNIRYSPVDLTLIEKTGKRICFVIKYFNSSNSIAQLQHRLRNLIESINRATSESTFEFDSIIIVFISTSEENSLNIMRKFERPSSFYQELLSENKILSYMVGYINENEFVKVSA